MQFIDELLAYRFGSTEVAAPDPEETVTTEVAAPDPEETVTTNAMLEIYMRHLRPQIDAKLQSRDLGVVFIPRLRRVNPIPHYDDDDDDDVGRMVYRTGDTTADIPLDSSEGQYEFSDKRCDSYGEIIKRGHFAPGMKSFVITAANITIYIEINLEPFAAMRPELPQEVPDNTNVILEMEMLTPTRTFYERHDQWTFGTFREDVANKITEAVKNFTEMYIMAQSGMDLNRFSRLSI
jgi:hypothetical protein